MVKIPIVVDTNVFVGALKSSGGVNRKIISLCMDGLVVPLMGAALFAEYEDLTARRSLFVNCPLNEGQRNELLDAFLSVCQWSSVYFLWRPNLRDEADNHLVELAAAGGAKVIVTHNVRDFAGEHMEFLGISPITPGEFLNALEAKR